MRRNSKLRRVEMEEFDQTCMDEDIQEKKKIEKRVKQPVRKKGVIKKNKILKILTCWAVCKPI